MNPTPTKSVRPWYKKKRYLIPIGTIIAITTLGSSDHNTSPQVQNTQTVTAASKQLDVPIPAKTYQVNTTSETDLSNNNYYTNTYGNTVHSPAYTEDNSIPVGASAQCRDGTYSFSQSRRGTCSHHGGVAVWL
jgi:hypothetical protein